MNVHAWLDGVATAQWHVVLATQVREWDIWAQFQVPGRIGPARTLQQMAPGNSLFSLRLSVAHCSGRVPHSIGVLGLQVL
jgi:hypothetical protein